MRKDHVQYLLSVLVSILAGEMLSVIVRMKCGSLVDHGVGLALVEGLLAVEVGQGTIQIGGVPPLYLTGGIWACWSSVGL